MTGSNTRKAWSPSAFVIMLLARSLPPTVAAADTCFEASEEVGWTVERRSEPANTLFRLFALVAARMPERVITLFTKCTIAKLVCFGHPVIAVKARERWVVKGISVGWVFYGAVRLD